MEQRNLQLEETSPVGLVKDGTYVCPKYDQFGKKTQSGQFIGSRGRIDKMALAIARHSAAHGEQLSALVSSSPAVKYQSSVSQASVKRRSSRSQAPGKAKLKVTQPIPQPEIKADITFTEADALADARYSEPKYKSLPQSPTTQILHEFDFGIDIVFQVASAKMKLTVCGLMEEKGSLCLVFKNDKELRFVPDAGTELKLLISNRVLSVYYPGTLFTWPDNEKKIMVLIKIDEK